MAAVVAQASEVDGRASAVASDMQRTRLPELEYSILDGNAVPAAQVRALREAAELAGQRGYLYNPYVGALHAQLTAAAAAAADGCRRRRCGCASRAATTPCSGWRRRTSCCAAPTPSCAPPSASCATSCRSAARTASRHTSRCATAGTSATSTQRTRAATPPSPTSSSPRGKRPNPSDRRRRAAPPNRRRGGRRRPSARRSTTTTARARGAAAQALRGALLPRAAARRRGEAVRDARLLRIRRGPAGGRRRRGAGARRRVLTGRPVGRRVRARRRQPTPASGRAPDARPPPLLIPRTHPRLGRYASPMSIGARFSSLSFSTFGLEPLHSPASGRLQMRCAHTTPNSKGTPSGPLRHVMRAKISCGAAALGDVVAGDAARQGGGRRALLDPRRRRVVRPVRPRRARAVRAAGLVGGAHAAARHLHPRRPPP